ncbi:MAG: hypothetical protein A2Y38_10675 [Spirochaetes bacterium GWB1_59_5]|nr:MAG: hypothetical protein A2Y38_10675 [Spirochaetes bacterium GWB1_59_5]
MAKIGIRLADGKFYPILAEGAAAKKRLVVTTVKDDQPSVQIDVYRSTEASEDYIGSLVIENIPPRPSGEPDIELDLALDDDGNLSALAREEVTGEHQALSVSLKSLAEEEKYEIPDFDFQEDEDFDLSTDNLPDITPFDSTESAKTDEGMAAKKTSFDDIPDFGEASPPPELVHREEKKRASPILIGALAALGTIIILVAAFFIYRATMDKQPTPPRAPVAAPVATAPAAPAAATPAPVAAAPAAPTPAAQAPVAAASAPAKPAEPAKKGTWYKIRWGDTLWDLSIAYYRTPWLYRTIAAANKIRNPDRIISGTWIFIPPR